MIPQMSIGGDPLSTIRINVGVRFPPHFQTFDKRSPLSDSRQAAIRTYEIKADYRQTTPLRTFGIGGMVAK